MNLTKSAIVLIKLEILTTGVSNSYKFLQTVWSGFITFISRYTNGRTSHTSERVCFASVQSLQPSRVKKVIRQAWKSRVAARISSEQGEQSEWRKCEVYSLAEEACAYRGYLSELRNIYPGYTTTCQPQRSWPALSSEFDLTEHPAWLPTCYVDQIIYCFLIER